MLKLLFGDEATILRKKEFQVLLLASAMPVLGITLVSPVLESLTDPLEVSSASVGLLISLYTAPAIVCIPIAGILADRFGRKPVLLVGLILFGLPGAAIALTSNFQVILGLRFLQGVGSAGIIPITVTIVGDLYSGTRESTAQGLRFSVSGVSSLVFPPLAGVLVVIAWQYPFLLYALTIPVALPVYWYLEEPSRTDTPEDGSKPVEETGDRTTDDTESRTTDDTEGRAQLRAFITLLSSRDVLSISLARGVQPVIFYGFTTYISFIVLRGLDGTPAQSGILIGIYSVVTAIAGSQSGRILDAFGNFRYPLLGGQVLMLVGLGLVAFAPSFSVALVGTIALAAGNGPVLTWYRSLITDFTDVTLRGSLVSATESLGRVTATATPIVLGVLITILSPLVGPVDAVRWSLFAGGTFATAVGMLLVLISVSK